jgi:hypothetical protein
MARTDQLVPVADGGWDGMIDAIPPTARRPGKYKLGQNIYPQDPTLGDGVVGRPGVRQVGATLATGAGNGLYQFFRKDGVVFTIAISGGKFYTLDWSTEVWTEVLTAAQLGAAGVSPPAGTGVMVQMLTYTNKVVINDGQSTPWAWDGTSGGGITKMTNAPIFAAGSMDVYNGRLIGIKATDPTTFVWSETDSLNTGYEAGGFNNAWTYVQTDQHRLYRMVASNDGIIMIRARAASQITGEVVQSWSSYGTREGVSDTIGSPYPFTALLYGANVFVLDADLRPQLLRPGMLAPTPLWTPFRETIKTLIAPRALDYSQAMAVYYSPAALILVTVCESASLLGPASFLVFDARENKTPVPVAIWRNSANVVITALAMMTSGATVASPGSTGLHTMVASTPYLMYGTATGQVYLMGNPGDDLLNDKNAAGSGGTVAVSHILETQTLGYSTKHEKIFDRIDLAATVESNAAFSQTLSVSVISPRGTTVAQAVTMANADDGHASVGIDVEARWVRVKVTHAVLGERFALSGIGLDAYGLDDDPPVP